MERKINGVLRLALLLAGASCLGTARAVPVFEAHLPDFYQHQKADQRVGSPPPLPLQTDPAPAPLLPGYNQTWDHDGDPATPERSRNWWEPTAGWCGSTAWTDIMYHWSQKGFTNLFDHSTLDPPVGPPYHGGRNWLERFTYANEDLAIRAGAGAGGGCAFPRRSAPISPPTAIATS